MRLQLNWAVILATILIWSFLIFWIYYIYKNKKVNLNQILYFSKHYDLLATSPFIQTRTLAIIRGILALFNVIVFIANIIKYGGTSLMFYTVWNYGILSFYFVPVTYYSAKMAYSDYISKITTGKSPEHSGVPKDLKPDLRTQESNPSQREAIAVQDLYNISVNKFILSLPFHVKFFRILTWFMILSQLCLTLLIDFIFWTILFPFADGKTKRFLLNFIPIIMHIFNLVFIYFDFCISHIPLQFHLGVIPCILACIYGFFAWIHYSLGGRWTYWFLESDKIYNGIFYIIVPGFHLLFWYFAYKITNYRDNKLHPYCVNKFGRSNSLYHFNNHNRRISRMELHTPNNNQINDTKHNSNQNV